LNDLLIDNIPFSNYTTFYDFQINVNNHNWTPDLLDNRICFGFKNDVTYYSYVYFFGAYGTPTGPAPVLSVVTSTGTPQNVDITMTPLAPPIVIPAIGGTFNYTVVITNNEAVPASFNAWIKALLPTGGYFSPILLRTVTLSAGGVLTRAMSQGVPGIAPAGNYSYIGCVGIYPSVVWDSSYFAFTKSALDEGKNPGIQNWSISGWDNESAEIIAPNTPLLFSAYPNPFNSETMLSFTLEEFTKIDLAIYNSLGEIVTQVHEGFMPAGEYEFRFDGDALPSGLYFARLLTNETSYTMKLLLIK
jgi:hypothetical protein